MASHIYAVFFLFLHTLRVMYVVNATLFESLPAVAMDYKVKVDAGKEDCYFQFVSPGATFYASFQVIFVVPMI